ncbi:Protein of unknown function DUF4541 [Cinara cedri]|uniref:Uncharacterized protein n=1 Tax=Cinara cedri TaxID=506608 RepID=A0A5E4M1Y8_9HEMI|nr:Protein of unknown function DUF4541 [Cinara cedri]
MADWYTPSQTQKALEITWRRFEYDPTPLKEIKDEDLINYYNNKQHVLPKMQYDLNHPTSAYDPNVKKDSAKSKKQIHENFYYEERQRSVPILTSHEYGHRFVDLEGRSLGHFNRVEDKSGYRPSGIPFDQTVGLPRSTNILDE